MVDVGELEDEGAAALAAFEVLLDVGRLALGQAASGVGAELVGVRPAGVLELAHDVLLQVGLAQPLAGPVGERGDPVGGQAEQRRDLARLQPLHLGVPQDGLPPLGQRGVGPRHDGLLQALDRGVDELDPGIVRGQVVGDLHPAAAAGAVVGDPAQRRQQVGAEGDVRPTAALQHDEHLGERLSDEVLRLVRVAGQLPGHRPGRPHVPVEQAPVRLVVAGPDRRDQLSVATTHRLFGVGLDAEREVGH